MTNSAPIGLLSLPPEMFCEIYQYVGTLMGREVNTLMRDKIDGMLIHLWGQLKNKSPEGELNTLMNKIEKDTSLNAVKLFHRLDQEVQRTHLQKIPSLFSSKLLEFPQRLEDKVNFWEVLQGTCPPPL